MKTFDDFLDSSNERFVELLENVINEHLQEQESLSAEEFASKILTVSREIMLDTLRLYHEWLSEQIQG